MDAVERHTDDDSFSAWKPEELLPVLTLQQVRLGAGVLSISPERLFPEILAFWSPFFHAIGASLPSVTAQFQIGAPAKATRSVLLEIDGEPCVLSMNREMFSFLASEVLATSDLDDASILVEYLERRLCSTLSRSWIGVETMNVLYAGNALEVNHSPDVVLALQWGDGEEKPIAWLALGPRTLAHFDKITRSIRRGSQREMWKFNEKKTYTLSIQIASEELPDKGIFESLRDNSVLAFRSKLTRDVIAAIDGEPWVSGKLCLFNGRFAVTVESLLPRRPKGMKAEDRLVVEIAQAEVEKLFLDDHFAVGAVLMTNSGVDDYPVLLAGDSFIADAELGEADGRLAVKVLGR